MTANFATKACVADALIERHVVFEEISTGSMKLGDSSGQLLPGNLS